MRTTFKFIVNFAQMIFYGFMLFFVFDRPEPVKKTIKEWTAGIRKHGPELARLLSMAALILMCQAYLSVHNAIRGTKA